MDEKDDCGISQINFENVIIGGNSMIKEQILCEGNVKNVKI